MKKRPVENKAIKNVTKKRILISSLELAETIGSKTKGLMFRKSLEKDAGLLMTFDVERKHEIWMFGMRFPIDIIFIDSEKRIVDIKQCAKPMCRNPVTWRIYRPEKKCSYVLEANAGLAASTGTEKGDVLEF